MVGEGGRFELHRDEALDGEGGGAGGEAERHDGGVQYPNLDVAQCFGRFGLQGIIGENSSLKVLHISLLLRSSRVIKLYLEMEPLISRSLCGRCINVERSGSRVLKRYCFLNIQMFSQSTVSV